MDIWDKQKRSEVMSKIRSKNTKPEITLRKALFAKGYRYRINYKKLPGKPDIVLRKYRTVIFINGCFWHGHDNCNISHIPKTNSAFWKDKIERNKERDSINNSKIKDLGWNIIVVWECELTNKANLKKTLKEVDEKLKVNAPFQQKDMMVTIYDYIRDEVQIVAEDIVPYNNRDGLKF